MAPDFTAQAALTFLSAWNKKNQFNIFLRLAAVVCGPRKAARDAGPPAETRASAFVFRLSRKIGRCSVSARLLKPFNDFHGSRPPR